MKEEDPSQREAGNTSANEASNEIPNRMLRLPMIKYEALTNLKDSYKKKIQKKVLKFLPFFFFFSDNSLAVKGFPVDKAKKIFCVVCERLLGFYNFLYYVQLDI